MVDPTDTALVETEAGLGGAAGDGDVDAFGDLVRLHYERVFRRIVSIVRNEHDARDLCQEVWVAAWNNLKHFRGEARFSTWLYPIATRRAIDHLRRRERWYQRFLPILADTGGPDTLATPEAGPRDSAENTEAGQRLHQAIQALPARYQAVLALREIEGLSYEQIAEALKCRPGTVMSRLFTARRLLAQKLGDSPCE